MLPLTVMPCLVPDGPVCEDLIHEVGLAFASLEPTVVKVQGTRHHRTHLRALAHTRQTLHDTHKAEEGERISTSTPKVDPGTSSQHPSGSISNESPMAKTCDPYLVEPFGVHDVPHHEQPHIPLQLRVLVIHSRLSTHNHSTQSQDTGMDTP